MNLLQQFEESINLKIKTLNDIKVAFAHNPELQTISFTDYKYYDSKDAVYRIENICINGGEIFEDDDALEDSKDTLIKLKGTDIITLINNIISLRYDMVDADDDEEEHCFLTREYFIN